MFGIRKGGHVRITGVNVTRDENDYRRLSVGRKRKDELYGQAVRYVMEKKSDRPYNVLTVSLFWQETEKQRKF